MTNKNSQTAKIIGAGKTRKGRASVLKHTVLIIIALSILGQVMTSGPLVGKAVAAPPFGSGSGNQGGSTGTLNNTTLEMMSSLHVLNVTFSDDKPENGELVNITIVLTNNGTINISGMAVSLYVDPNAFIELPPLWSNVVSIAPNETLEMKLNWTAEPGSHAFLLKAKYADATLLSRRDTIFVRGDELGSPTYPFLALAGAIVTLAVCLAAPSFLAAYFGDTRKRQGDKTGVVQEPPNKPPK